MEESEIGSKLNSKFWRLVFVVAGLFTSFGVIPGIIKPKDGLMTFASKDLNDFYSIYFFQSLWLVVLIFGIGYLIVATNPTKHVGIVIMGFLGKFVFAINVLYHAEHLSRLAFFAAIIDFVFVFLFGVFIFLYWRNRTKES